MSGVHVGRLGDCGRRCELEWHSFIQAIDGTPVIDANSVYRLLSDDSDHRVLVRTRAGEEEEISLHIQPEDLPDFAFVGVDLLLKTPDGARDERWGFTNPRSVFYGQERQWALPDELFGTAHIIVDLPNDRKWSFLSALRNAGPASLPVFLVRASITDSEEFDPHEWTSEERQIGDGHSWMMFVTSPWNTRKKPTIEGSGFFGHLSTTPNLMVIDCHGVVRWHADGWRLSDPSEDEMWVARALDFGAELVREAARGECWMP